MSFTDVFVYRTLLKKKKRCLSTTSASAVIGATVGTAAGTAANSAVAGGAESDATVLVGCSNTVTRIWTFQGREVVNEA